VTSPPPREPSRRSFLNWFLGTTLGALAAAVVYPVARFLSPPAEAEASARQVEAGRSNDPEFLERGFKIVQFGSEPVIVLRAAEDDFRAFAATCTHLSCIVEYRKSVGLLWCNCHNGQFDLQGRVVAGPPPRPLTAFQVHLVAASGGAPTVVVARA
jgi:cytochrome b6-f complex iron-sulfur subunit